MRLAYKIMAALEDVRLAELGGPGCEVAPRDCANPEHSRMEMVEQGDVKQWIAIRQSRDGFESEP